MEEEMHENINELNNNLSQSLLNMLKIDDNNNCLINDCEFNLDVNNNIAKINNNSDKIIQNIVDKLFNGNY